MFKKGRNVVENPTHQMENHILRSHILPVVSVFKNPRARHYQADYRYVGKLPACNDIGSAESIDQVAQAMNIDIDVIL